LSHVTQPAGQQFSEFKKTLSSKPVDGVYTVERADMLMLFFSTVIGEWLNS
jgi:hypothetical protein